MAFFCADCAERRPGGSLKGPCTKCGATAVDRVPPLDGCAWFGEHPTDEEAAKAREEHFAKKRR